MPRLTVPLAAAFAFYLAAVILPNLLIDWYGVVDVAPGPSTLMAPAAVYGVGVALVARDILHAIGGRTLTLVAIGLGTIISAVLASPAIALASGAAFAVSEVLDLGVYERLLARGWAVAALLSSYVGALVDSLIFLWLAFGSFTFLPGQWVGKAIAITLFVAVAAPTRRWWGSGSRRQPAAA